MQNNNTPTESTSPELAEASMTGIQNTTLVEQRRDQICEAALELFLQKGFASTTIRDICARSGVNQASIYDYIANKNDILRRLLNKMWFRSGAPNLYDLLEEHPDRPLKENVAIYLKEVWAKKRKGTLLAYRTVPHLTKPDRKAMRERDARVIGELAGQIRHLTELPDDDPRAQVVANLVIFLGGFGPLRDWLHTDLDSDLVADTVATAIVAMIESLTSHPSTGAAQPTTDSE
ncbi:TetR/AcrR family transcriptional regulator [Marinobacter sp. M1N3S26]|uniref:TetR/AcrR family transcriptional regulator n=1 Tax=unclassified Marinobacter TaxID=83889 RepID=UPI00387AF51E